MVKKIVLWTLVLACMAMIFSFSAQNSDESNDLSGSFLDEILDVLKIELDSDTLQVCNVLIRKAAHFSIYVLLGALVSILLRVGYHIDGKRAVLIPAVWVLLYAVSDEIHQIFVAGRSGQFSDVCVDTFGGLTGTVLIWIIARFKR